MIPKANKTGLVYLLRARGYDVPSIGAAAFEPLWQGMALYWGDRAGKPHTAYLYMGTVEPVLQIGSRTEEVTAEELERFGLVEDKKRSPCAAEADTQAHEDTIMIPQFAELCKG